ncbi:hypothetical protein HMN09_01364700 [Mycena chlorophos]|uniref:F-box domain-containing protein n=1 Tax=Mycena chlorophos TaxID=658473 RepID=A0A8H6VSW1_MYCCL|nr:hypothetical protein HMN09_01364700 [Mycena chlorophos]
MSSSPGSTLPPEIWALVVDGLPDDASLRALSLTSSTFTELCQRRLFSSLTLHPQRGSHRASYREVTVHLSAHPRLAAYIKTLKIYLRKPTVSVQLGGDELAITLDALHWVLERLAQPDVALERIKIRIPGEGSEWADWMHGSVQRLLEQAARQNSVHHLSLKMIDYIPQSAIYRALWGCRSLNLMDTHVEGTVEHKLEIPAEDALVRKPALRKLQLSGTNSLYELLLHPGVRRCASALVSLSIDGPGLPAGDHLVLGLQLAALCSETLEELTVILFGSRVNEHETFDHDLPRLRTLKLAANYEQLHEINHWVIPCAFAILLQVSSRFPALANLHIYLGISVDHRPLPPLASHYVLSGHFKSLDNALQPYIASEVEVKFAAKHHLSYTPESSGERREDLAQHWVTFSQGLWAALPKSFASGLRLVQWD